MTARPTYARPLDAVERVLRLSREGIGTERRIVGDEPFFAGHYPGFPIFPGMFQVETALQASRLYAEEHELPVSLTEVRSRFLSAVRPGDLLECECTCALTDERTRLRVDATCRTGQTRTATVKLVFAVERTAAMPERREPRARPRAIHGHGDLRAVLAHRFPMLLVDAIVSLKPWDQIIGRKAITGSDFCYAGVPEGADRRAFAYPASLVMESFGQTAGVLINTRRRHRGAPANVVMLAAGITRFGFFDEAYPGDVLEHHAAIDKDLEDFAVIAGEVRVGRRRLAEVEGMIVAYRPAHTIGRTNGGGGT